MTRDVTELKPYQVGTQLLWTVKWTTGGQVPDSLKGFFNSAHAAQKAIDIFYEEKDIKIKGRTKRGQTSPTTAD